MPGAPKIPETTRVGDQIEQQRASIVEFFAEQLPGLAKEVDTIIIFGYTREHLPETTIDGKVSTTILRHETYNHSSILITSTKDLEGILAQKEIFAFKGLASERFKLIFPSDPEDPDSIGLTFEVSRSYGGCADPQDRYYRLLVEYPGYKEPFVLQMDVDGAMFSAAKNPEGEPPFDIDEYGEVFGLLKRKVNGTIGNPNGLLVEKYCGED